MRKMLIAALSAQLCLSPAFAADLLAERETAAHQTGAFVGARVRMALGGGEERGQLRAGLVMAPTLRSLSSDGRVTTRFGEGLELGARQDRPLTLSLAGQPLAGPESQRPRAGVSTLGWIAIGTAIVVAAGVIWFVDAMNDPHD